MRYLVMLCLCLFSYTSGYTQPKADSSAAARVLNTLISLSQAGEHGKAAAYILYTGKDDKTANKIASDYRKTEHRDLVDEFCIDVKKILVDSKSRKINSYVVDKDDDGTWHILELECTYEGNKNKKISVEFLKINGKFLCGGVFD